MSAVLAMGGLTFGCDPELFIVNKDGDFVTAEGIVPGTKEDPYKVPCGAVQVDGMAAEFNIDPVSTYADWEHNITTVMAELKKFLPDGHKLVVTPSAVFSEAEWEKTPDNAKVLGCSPDFNAWTGSVNPPPEDLDNPRLRCAGGHIHFGWTEGADMTDIQHIVTCRDLVKQMDWYLGMWSLRMDKDVLRRRLYGKAGALRFKDYGVEYRTLSNFWISNKSRRRATWDRMQRAIWDMRSAYAPSYGSGAWNDRIIQAISTSQRDKFLEENFSFPILKVL